MNCHPHHFFDDDWHHSGRQVFKQVLAVCRIEIFVGEWKLPRVGLHDVLCLVQVVGGMYEP